VISLALHGNVTKFHHYFKTFASDKNSIRINFMLRVGGVYFQPSLVVCCYSKNKSAVTFFGNGHTITKIS